MKKLILILTITLALLLTGCEEPIQRGTVIDKNHDPAYTILMPIYNGKSMSFIPEYHPESYTITFEGENQDGETRQRTVGVTSDVYKSRDAEVLGGYCFEK